MRDKYNLNTMPASANESEEVTTSDQTNVVPMIPGMAPEDRVEPMHMPGLDSDFSRVPPPLHVTTRGNAIIQVIVLEQFGFNSQNINNLCHGTRSRGQCVYYVHQKMLF